MKKRIISIILVAALVIGTVIPASAYSDKQLNAADALYNIGLFLGYGESYGLDNTLTRYEGYSLMIRMLGDDEAAKNCKESHPFKDIAAKDAWALPYVKYSYATGLTKGVSATQFGGTSAMTAQQFCAICLRALGYEDVGGKDFSYDNAIAFAREKGILNGISSTATFKRGDCVIMFWNTLNALLKGSDKTLAATLIEKGVFTQAAFDNAARIQKNGISAGDGSGEKNAVRISEGDPRIDSDPADSDKPQKPVTDDSIFGDDFDLPPMV